MAMAIGRAVAATAVWVLANAEDVDADLVGKDALLDDVADGLGVRQRAVVVVMADVAGGVETEDEGNGHGVSHLNLQVTIGSMT
jgi:hypothetical protein